MPKGIKRYPAHQSQFFCLRSKKELAKILRISPAKLKELTKTEELYSIYLRYDPKKGREVVYEEPKPLLKEIHKRLKKILSHIEIPDYICCPNLGYSCIDNAKIHLNSTVVYTLDIKKYFPSTLSKRVFWFFHKYMKCSEDVAATITKISTFDGHLATGSPVSPLLSYFVHIEMWEEIREITIDANCQLSVWADDITISGPSIPRNTIWDIKKAIWKRGLRYHKEELYTGKRYPIITGVILKEGKVYALNRTHLKRFNTYKEIKYQLELIMLFCSWHKHPLSFIFIFVNQIMILAQRLKGLNSYINQAKS